MITPGSPLIPCSSLQESLRKVYRNKGLWARAVDSTFLISQADSGSPISLGNLDGHVYLVEPGCPLPQTPRPKVKSPQDDKVSGVECDPISLPSRRRALPEIGQVQRQTSTCRIALMIPSHCPLAPRCCQQSQRIGQHGPGLPFGRPTDRRHTRTRAHPEYHLDVSMPRTGQLTRQRASWL